MTKWGVLFNLHNQNLILASFTVHVCVCACMYLSLLFGEIRLLPERVGYICTLGIPQ